MNLYYHGKEFDINTDLIEDAIYKVEVGICVSDVTRKNAKFSEKSGTLLREECKVTIILSLGIKKIPE